MSRLQNSKTKAKAQTLNFPEPHTVKLLSEAANPQSPKQFETPGSTETAKCEAAPGINHNGTGTRPRLFGVSVFEYEQKGLSRLSRERPCNVFKNKHGFGVRVQVVVGRVYGLGLPHDLPHRASLLYLTTGLERLSWR